MGNSKSPSGGKGLVRRIWDYTWSPSGTISLGVLVLVGFVGGILFWGGFHWSLELTNTEDFCTSCHEMRDNPYAEMQGSIHAVNRTGVGAICSDCHVPRQWAYKVKRKIAATAEVWAHLTGKIDTPEKFEAHRLEMAVSVWGQMHSTDSRECRNCHAEVWMNMTAQFGGARRNHTFAVDNDLTCIDCHQGIAHKLPDGFERPSNEDLVADSRAWLTRMETLAASASNASE